ncbi:MAG: 2-dehydro-3-deoxygalactonokinase [Burkholderiaceae bacterium]|nr:2-dehydro-3-deoxygalactonokinase [Burkholderiaceae bacterium]
MPIHPTQPTQPFIAVDWGTSSFRAALVSPQGAVLDELAAPRGILGFKPDEFVPYLSSTCARLTAAGGAGAALFLLSGMIGSKNGLLEVPYCPCPATPLDVATALGWVKTSLIPNQIAIVPGVRSGFDDVMRGEEIQVFGAAAVLGLQDAVMVLPGTHSKWVQLAGGAIVKFNTFMTGEFYALLAQHSILAKSLPEVTATPAALDTVAFLQGIDRAQKSSESGQTLLGNAFSTRVKSLFNELQPAQAASYLSGLVIGDELAAMRLPAGSQVIVIGSATLCERYTLALAHLGVQTRPMGNQAAWAGLHSIYTQISV